jgi:hypothetical protein
LEGALRLRRLSPGHPSLAGVTVDEFLIPSTAGSGGLLFYSRLPSDSTKPIEGFWVQVTDHNLAGAVHVYAGYQPSHPAGLFADMARHWSGWKGELTWGSLEGELNLRCSCDRLGHIAIRVELQSGGMPDDWRVEASVMTEAGQLEAIARQAKSFFGREA